MQTHRSPLSLQPMTAASAVRNWDGVRLRAMAAGLAVVAASAWLGSPARAHDAPTGWSYPFSCCSNYDCRPVATKAVSERPEGYVIETTGETLAYSDTRVKNSPDGDFHWCSIAGKNDSRTICLFVPPRAY